MSIEPLEWTEREVVPPDRQYERETKNYEIIVAPVRNGPSPIQNDAKGNVSGQDKKQEQCGPDGSVSFYWGG